MGGKRDHYAKQDGYLWANGIDVQERREDAAAVRADNNRRTPEGKKELVGPIDGVRESAQYWKRDRCGT